MSDSSGCRWRSNLEMSSTSSIVSVFVISPDVHSERRYDLHTTIAQLKVIFLAAINVWMSLNTPVTGEIGACNWHSDFKSNYKALPYWRWYRRDRYSWRWWAAFRILQRAFWSSNQGTHYRSLLDDLLSNPKIEDSNPSATLTGQFTDLSQVEKFELTQEEYERRQGECWLCTSIINSSLYRYGQDIQGDTQDGTLCS